MIQYSKEFEVSWLPNNHDSVEKIQNKEMQ